MPQPVPGLYISSNLDLGAATTNVHDAALLDRFIEIEFPHVPLRPAAGVLDFWIKNTSALINWALCVPKEVLQAQVRASGISKKTLENDPYTSFVASTMAVSPGAFYPNADLLDDLETYLAINGFKQLGGYTKRTIPSKIKNIVRKFFRANVVEGRTAQKRGLRGVCKLDLTKPGKDKPLTLPQEGWGLPWENFPCFERGPIVPYDALTSDFVPETGPEFVEEVEGPEEVDEQTQGSSPAKPAALVPEIVPPWENVGPCGSAENLVSASIERWHLASMAGLSFHPYSPWTNYPGCEEAHLVYNQWTTAPKAIWGPLLAWFELHQTAERRHEIYSEVGEREIKLKQSTKERSWFENKRKKGVLDFVFPSEYERVGASPRLWPRKSGGGEGKQTLLNVHKVFRQKVLEDLDSTTWLFWGDRIYEIDIRSCHLAILAGLGWETPKLTFLLENNVNIWNFMIEQFPDAIRSAYDFRDLKACAKILSYKCLQGGRVDDVGKIRKTLVDAKRIREDGVFQLAEEFGKNQVLQEFDILNAEIAKRKQDNVLCVYTPIDCQPYIYKAWHPKKEKGGWVTSNICRVASQILTGVEIFEKMRDLRLNMIPISLHHDGFAILARPETVRSDLELLAETTSENLSRLGLRPVQLEISNYRKDEPEGMAPVDRPPRWIRKYIRQEDIMAEWYPEGSKEEGEEDPCNLFVTFVIRSPWSKGKRRGPERTSSNFPLFSSGKVGSFFFILFI